MRSLNHGIKSSESQQPFLTVTVISIVKRWKKTMATFLFLSEIMHKKVIQVNVFVTLLFLFL